MAITVFLPFLIFLVITELVYFKIADRFNIIDKPNHRSSHSAITIRGGGIVFSIAAITYCIWNEFAFPFFVSGLFLIALISFLDDILTLNNKIRLTIHLTAVLLLFYEWQIFSLHWLILLGGLIFVIGTINAYNFMDGINGITGCYSATALVSLLWLNEQGPAYTDSGLILAVLISVLVFGFFNFRKKAKCFAGDVGSVSIAFILLFLHGQLIFKTGDFAYIFLLLVYGLDAVTTILFRLVRGENIFQAHRSHYYQYLANEKKWPHLLIAALYAGVQLGVNTLLFMNDQTLSYRIACVAVVMVAFIMLRFATEGRFKLLNKTVV